MPLLEQFIAKQREIVGYLESRSEHALEGGRHPEYGICLTAKVSAEDTLDLMTRLQALLNKTELDHDREQ